MEEVPVVFLIREGPCNNSVFPVGSNKPVVHAIVGATLLLANFLAGFEFKLVGVVDPAKIIIIFVDGDTASFEVNAALNYTVPRGLPLFLQEVVLGEGVWAVVELDVILGLGVVKHKFGSLLTINCHDSVHGHLGDKEDALVDLVKEDGHLPLYSLAVSAGPPEDHSVEGRLLSHGHLVKVLHLELGSIVGLDIKDHLAFLDDILTVGDLVDQGESSVGSVLPASLVGPGAVHVVGKEGKEEGSPGCGVVVLDVVPGLAIKDVVLLHLHLVDHVSLVDLVKEEVAGVLHLGPLPTTGNHDVHPVEGALLGDNKGVLGHQLKLLCVVDPLVCAPSW